jgi:hypothetical protein
MSAGQLLNQQQPGQMMPPLDQALSLLIWAKDNNVTRIEWGALTATFTAPQKDTPAPVAAQPDTRAWLDQQLFGVALGGSDGI